MAREYAKQKVELEACLVGHTGAIGALAWSPDGRFLASPSLDETVRVWDGETGDSRSVAEGHEDSVLAIAWAPDGARLASASADQTIRVWTVRDGVIDDPAQVIVAHSGHVCSLDWHPEGEVVASGGDDATARLWCLAGERWQARHGETVLAAQSGINSVAFSPDGQFLAVGTEDHVVRLVAMAGAVVELRDHTGGIEQVAWSSDGRLLATASQDGTTRIWDPAAGKVRQVLEGHTAPVTSCKFSADGAFLATKGLDSRVRIWDCTEWHDVATIHESPSGYRGPRLAFHPRNSNRLATLGPRPGFPIRAKESTEAVVRLWRLDTTALKAASRAATTVKYVTAKVVLVGESGVGKTGLGWRLAHGHFREHASSHGQQFWVVEDLAERRADGAECEAILWDLAGQPDYRLIHALFVDDADIALILFNPQQADPLAGVNYWLQSLRGREGRPTTFLVASRIDLGNLMLTEHELAAFCDLYGVDGHVATSAMTGAGLHELTDHLRAAIAWDNHPVTTTTFTFSRVKDLVLDLKERHDATSFVTDIAGLRASLTQRDPTHSFTDEELAQGVSNCAKHGFVQILRTSSGGRSVLLAPELLNNLASSIILEARRNPYGLGALEENQVLRNQYRFPELEGVNESDRAVLTDAAVLLFLEHNIALRESLGANTYLVFPELINRPVGPSAREDELEDGSAYSVTGQVENLYAALVVLLGYTRLFYQIEHWRDQAQYRLADDEVCGFRQTKQHDGELEFELYYSRTAGDNTRVLFQSLFERFLVGRNVEVRRFPPVVCPTCGYRQDRSQIIHRRRDGKDHTHCGECGFKLKLGHAGRVLRAGQPGESVSRLHASATGRTAFEAALMQVKLLAADRRPARAPACFVSYAWGDRRHELWVEKQLAADLTNAGVDVILDRWHNAEIGANIARFIERIAACDWIIAVGTPLYLKKYTESVLRPAVVSAEIDLINQRLTSTEAQKRSVLPLIVEGEETTALPPLMRGRVRGLFRDQSMYFRTLFDVLLTIHGIPFNDPAVLDLRAKLDVS